MIEENEREWIKNDQLDFIIFKGYYFYLFSFSFLRFFSIFSVVFYQREKLSNKYVFVLFCVYIFWLNTGTRGTEIPCLRS